MAKKVEQTHIDALFPFRQTVASSASTTVYAYLSAARNTDFGGEQSPFPFCPFHPASHRRESARVLYLGWRRGKYGVGALDWVWELTWSVPGGFGGS